MQVLLSIIVPMYNAERYVGECLESLLDQGFDDGGCEIIIVNDGSADDSIKVAERYADQHANIRIVNQENRGQSAARNAGIRAAKGEYICFADADDFLLRRRLSSMVRIAQDLDAEVLTYDLWGGSYQAIRAKMREIGEGCSREVSMIMTGIEYIAKHNYNNGPWY